ncbi:acyl-CoA carboxylase subunit beta [Winogradskya consettensis]|uniref:Methylmalonyl-CoA carboxyltransferase n=1 Tax=Winogradskya consettensis TaxID=113560 RepID=A0A919T2Z3_9ACTN|nr:acyl-CoA carboxylase subunit beta [Actinoplanes consettensis]GIM82394.1 methylmalonyl-CoA carboxyltransferase [Actinoplanes consettensis]
MTDNQVLSPPNTESAGPDRATLARAALAVAGVGEPAPTTAERLAGLDERRQEISGKAEARAVAKQHAKGKLTARERIDLLFDEGTFIELDAFVRHRVTDFGMDRDRPYGDGVIIGHGLVNGRRVCAFSQDFTVLGGSMGEAFGAKMNKIQDFATTIGCPVIGLNDSGGARIQEGVVSLGQYAELGRRIARASGVIPQISLVLGPCAGGAAYTPQGTDIIVMAEETSFMFVTGPEVIAAVTGERTTLAELGGPAVNSEVSGNVHHVAADDKEAIAWVCDLLSYLPTNNMSGLPSYAYEAQPEITDRDRELDTIIPDSATQAYDMRRIIDRVIDEGSFLEIQRGFATNLICGFGFVNGRPVGVVANQPLMLSGAIDIDASSKGARFVRFCDAFDIPILTVVDVPGYLPGVQQERDGIIRHGAKLGFAYADATTPMVTVVVNKAYGGGYGVMGSKHLGADINLAWPTAEIAVVGAQAGVHVLHRREIAEAEPADRRRVIGELTESYRTKFSNPYFAAERGYLDAVIQPRETRLQVAAALDALRHKKVEFPARKHCNMPL